MVSPLRDAPGEGSSWTIPWILRDRFRVFLSAENPAAKRSVPSKACRDIVPDRSFLQLSLLPLVLSFKALPLSATKKRSKMSAWIADRRKSMGKNNED